MVEARNPLLQLTSLGQSIWMDFLDREIITSGRLQSLVDGDGLRGVTSNPSIFQQAVGKGQYADLIEVLASGGRSAKDIYLSLAVDTIQRAADVLWPVYQRLDGQDGFVSLEVSPGAAHDTAATIAEARSLWGAVNRPNAMIKVPATREGLPAIRQLVDDGVNVNITLLFGLGRYEEVAEAYLSGLEDRVRRGAPIERVASVASFFLSRIDVLVDAELQAMQQSRGSSAEVAGALMGECAIACARTAYQIYKRTYGNERYERLAARGARPQRLLWASTGTKNPAYSDVKYVEALIGPDTINTLPPETLEAYRDHGDPAPRLELDLAQAAVVLDRLARLGIDLDAVTQKLEDQGIEKFAKAFELLIQALEPRQEAAGARATRASSPL